MRPTQPSGRTHKVPKARSGQWGVFIAPNIYAKHAIILLKGRKVAVEVDKADSPLLEEHEDEYGDEEVEVTDVHNMEEEGENDDNSGYDEDLESDNKDMSQLPSDLRCVQRTTCKLLQTSRFHLESGLMIRRNGRI